MDDEIHSTETLDDAIAWVMLQQDRGTSFDLHSATQRFPKFADELQNFFSNEQNVLRLAIKDHERELAEKFAHYELMEVLGRGSFGEVRRAWDTKLKREVALKVPRFASTDRDSMRRFLREARSASKLAHPNIVRLYEIGEHNSTPYIITELLDGVQLREWKERPLPHAVAIKMVIQIAEGLEHAHAEGVIHRDLNPKNILVDRADAPHILDFGLAKLASGDETVTIQGQVLGTPAYVSPEQIDGMGHDVDGRTDIYALGVILFELLTGKRPFDGPLRLLLHRIQHEDAMSPLEIDPDLPGPLGEICLNCLAKSPHDRYASATDLIRDLRYFQANPNATKPAKPASVQSSSKNKSRWMLGSLAAALALALATGFAISRWPTPVSSEPHTSTTRSTEETKEIAQTDATPIIHNQHTVLRGHNGTVAMITVVPERDLFVACDHTGEVKGWDLNSRKVVWTNSDHTKMVWAGACSPDGSQTATASWDFSSHILSNNDGRLLHTLTGHTDEVCCVEFLASGQTVLTGGMDDTIRFWNTASWKANGPNQAGARR